MRLHLFEFEDLKWFPNVIRTGGTDYLRYFLIKTEVYKPCIPLLYKTIKITSQPKIIDLCAGGGGYTEKLYDELMVLEKDCCTITLTDKFPNIQAFELIAQRNNNKINFISEEVDVFNIPKKLTGIRVMFSAIHHFKPAQVKDILQDAVNANQPICIFDGGEKGLHAILGLLIIHPIAFLFCTPFFKPFKLSRILFTYIIPLIPLYTIWDGVVSILRMYTSKDFKRIIASLDNNEFIWEYGNTKNRFGLKTIYLIGYPKA